jgi:low affinity Fe/Cu permease
MFLENVFNYLNKNTCDIISISGIYIFIIIGISIFIYPNLLKKQKWILLYIYILLFFSVLYLQNTLLSKKVLEGVVTNCDIDDTTYVNIMTQIETIKKNTKPLQYTQTSNLINYM